MKWTKEKPIEPGWYWCKPPEGKAIVVYADASERLIFPNTKIHPEVIAIGYDQFTNDFKFAGPIPEPEDESNKIAKHCSFCHKLFKDGDEQISTYTDILGVTLCRECYDKAGNTVR